MKDQLRLFDDIGTPDDVTQFPKQKADNKIEELLHKLSHIEYIWDMRAWKQYHDKFEVTEWVMQDIPDHKNCGHAGWCIERLKELNVETHIIVNAIMQNNNIQYKNRHIPCMIIDASENCPVWNDNCSDTPCSKCQNDSGITHKMLSENKFRSKTSSKITDDGITFETRTEICHYAQSYKDNDSNLADYIKFYYPMYVKDFKNW